MFQVTYFKVNSNYAPFGFDCVTPVAFVAATASAFTAGASYASAYVNNTDSNTVAYF